MVSSDFQFQIIQLNSLLSTNSYAHQLLNEKKAKHGTVIWAHEQTKGRGQMGTYWQSEAGKDLTFSVIIESGVEVSRQFEISRLVALSLKYCLDTMAVKDVSVKWPNDIMVADKKIAGILIENTLLGSKITKSIIGIGLNVNASSFPNFPRKATSLYLESGEQYSLANVLSLFLNNFKKYFIRWESGEKSDTAYLKSQYGYGRKMRFSHRSGEFEATIAGFKESGELIVESSGILKTYQLKELRYLD